MAPSVPAIVEFLSESPEPTEPTETTDHETTHHLLECLERVAEERPNAITDHVVTISNSSSDDGKGRLGVALESDASDEREDEVTSDEPPSSAAPEHWVNFHVE